MRPDRDGPGRAGYDRLPLRGADRVEDAVAWLLGAGALLALFVAVFIGFTTYTQDDARARADAAERTPVRVTLIDPGQVVPADRTATLRWVSVGWTGPDGLPRLGNLILTLPAAAGTQRTAWVNRSGELTAPPSAPVSAVLAGVLIALGVVATSWIAVAAAWGATRQLTTARKIEGWAREWAQVAPEWTGRTR